jgi:hypothetical protein
VKRLLGILTAALGAQERALVSHEHKDYSSPQHFALELRLAPYTPQVDNEPSLGGKTPYRDTFGSTPRLELAAEFDWQALRIPHVGTLGPGISAGITSMTAKAPKSDGTGLSAEDTSLSIYPFYLVAVFRADVLSRELGIPLVPYVKGGLGYALWRASNAVGTSATDSVAGKGHTVGTNFALGIGLNLNAFDRRSAHQLDQATGVNNTYLFAEWMVAALNGLGQSSALHVGTNTWVAGLAFEF